MPEYNHLVITGNGSVEGGWDLVKEAYIETYSPQSKLFDESVLAMHYFKMAYLTHQYFQDKSFKDPRAYHKTILEYHRFIENIASKFEEAQTKGHLRLRNSAILKILNREKTIFATTNWDTTLESYISKEVIYLHGSIDNHYFYLPTQGSQEFSYLFDNNSLKKEYEETLKGLNENTKTAFDKFLGSGKVSQASTFPMIDEKHREQYKAITLWGLGLNTYDVELNTILGTFLAEQENITHIIVINPDRGIVKKAKILFPDKEIEWINPNSKGLGSKMRRLYGKKLGLI